MVIGRKCLTSRWKSGKPRRVCELSGNNYIIYIYCSLRISVGHNLCAIDSLIFFFMLASTVDFRVSFSRTLPTRALLLVTHVFKFVCRFMAFLSGCLMITKVRASQIPTCFS